MIDDIPDVERDLVNAVVGEFRYFRAKVARRTGLPLLRVHRIMAWMPAGRPYSPEESAERHRQAKRRRAAEKRRQKSLDMGLSNG